MIDSSYLTEMGNTLIMIADFIFAASQHWLHPMGVIFSFLLLNSATWFVQRRAVREAACLLPYPTCFAGRKPCDEALRGCPIHLQAHVTGNKRAQLRADVAALRREAGKYNTPATYAKSAKYQRLALLKEKELSGLAKSEVETRQEKIEFFCTLGKVRASRGFMGAGVAAAGRTMLSWRCPAMGRDGGGGAAACRLQGVAPAALPLLPARGKHASHPPRACVPNRAN